MTEFDPRGRLTELQEMLASEPDEALRNWFLQEYELTKEGRALRATLNSEFAWALGRLINLDNREQGASVASGESNVLIDTVTPEEASQSSDAAAIKWASDLMDDFIQLPKTRPVKAKKAESRDHNYVSKQLERVNIDGEDRGLAIHDPELLGQALETWAAMAAEKNGRTKQFLDTAIIVLGEHAENNYGYTTKGTLAQTVAQLTHRPLAEKGLSSVLKGYFNGPRKVMDKLDAYINFCLAAQYLVDDQQAFDRLAYIAAFQEDNIAGLGSQMHREIISTLVQVDDDQVELCQRGQDALTILAGVERLSNNGIDAYHKFQGPNFIDMDQGLVHQRMARLGVSQARASEDLNIRRSLLNLSRGAVAGGIEEFLVRVREQVGVSHAEWLEAVKFGEHPDLAEYFTTIGYRAIQSLAASELAKEKPYFKDASQISLPFLDRFQVDLVMPKGSTLTDGDMAILMQQLKDKYEQSIKNGDSAVQDLEKFVANPASRKTTLNHIELEHNGHEFAAFIRGRSNLDKLAEHDINKLLFAEIPDIDGVNFSRAEEIANRIQQFERRFVSKRGFIVHFNSQPMVAAGFESICFKQDQDDSGSLRVELVYDFGNQKVTYRINKYKLMDLENKTVHSSKLKDVIERRTLAILEDYATREAIETSEGEISGAERGTTSRIATLVYLPEGHNFSSEAWEHYFYERGGDLRARSLQRKTQDQKGRNTTYRRATEVDDSTQTPLEIYVENPAIV